MNNLNRRTFLNTSLVLSSIPFVRGFIKNHENLDLAYDQGTLFSVNSGNFMGSSLMGVSILKVDNLNKLSKELKELRQTHSYYSQIKYHSNDRFKIQICKEIINLFVNEKISLFIKTLENPKQEISGLSPLKKIDFRLNIYKDLLQEIDASNHVKVIFKTESPFGPSRDFVKKMELDDQLKLSFQTVKGKEDDVLQMISFLSGSIIGELRGMVKNPVKKELQQYLKDSLGIAELSSETRIGNKLIII